MPRLASMLIAQCFAINVGGGQGVFGKKKRIASQQGRVLPEGGARLTGN